MTAVAFSNNDIAVVAWTVGRKLKDCIGVAVHRIDVRPGTETWLPAMQAETGGVTPAIGPHAGTQKRSRPSREGELILKQRI